MKKYFKILMIMILVAFPFVTVNAKTTKKAEKEPINFYIFYGSTCGHCQKLHNYTATLEKDKTINSKFHIVDYEVWGDKNNSDLMTKVGSYFNFNVDGVPFYVIGDQYFTGFSEESSPEKIVKAINEEYSDSKYVDVVAGIQNGSIKVDSTGSNTQTEKNKKNDVVGYVILGITAAVVVAILFGRSNASEYVEPDSETDIEVEEKEEEVKDTKKTEKQESKSKKTSTSKNTTNKNTTKKNTKKSKK